MVMLDPARMMESKRFYLDLLPWLARWGYNAIHLHFADDEACRIVLPSHPEIASDNAWSVEELRTLLAAARDVGLRVIPELECLGHTRFITRCPKHAKLGADPKQGFSALDPRKKATRQLLIDLLTDVAELFDDPWLHVGMDEVNLAALPRYRKLAKEEADALFIEHAAWLHEQVRCLGKRPAMWGDHLQHYDASPDVIERDVIVFDWHYEPDVQAGPLASFCRQGFEVVACPSTMCWLARVVTSAGNLRNVRRFTADAMAYRRRTARRPGRVIGMNNTVWCPFRHLPGAMDYPMALAGHLFTAEHEQPAFAETFCRDFYGLPAQAARPAADALRALHELSPDPWDYNTIIDGQGWSGPFNREHVRLGAQLADQLKPVIAGLKRAHRAAGTHKTRLEELILCARVLERVGRFAAANRRKDALPDGRPLRRACEKAWLRSRDRDWGDRLRLSAPAQYLMPTLDRIT